MWFFEIIFTIIFEYFLIGFIGGILGYTGALVMCIIGGLKKPVKHYMDYEKYNIQPHLYGVGMIIILCCLINNLVLHEK